MHHSLAVGTFAQHIASKEGQPRERIDDAFLAGVMHDVGKLVLAASLPERYAEAIARAAETNTRLWEAEQAVFGAAHGEVGAYLLGLWGFSDNVVEAVAFHHSPAASPHGKFRPLTAVHVADFFERAAESSVAGSESEALAEYLATLGLTERLGPWTEAREEAWRKRSRA